MSKQIKYLIKAITEELKESSELSLLLKRITHKYIAQQKASKNKSKDRGYEKGNKKPKNQPNTSTKSQDKNRIRQIVEKHHIGIPHIKITNQPKLSEEQKLIINWDFEGINLHRETLLLSTYFQNALQTSENYDVGNRYNPKEYDLNHIPIWNEMKKFKNFQTMWAPICQQLSIIGYPPEDLNLLNIYDVAYLIKKHNKSTPPYKSMSCQRTKFLKMFAACYSDEFISKERLLGREETAKNFIEYISILDTDKEVSDSRWEALLHSASLYNVHHKKNRQFAIELDEYHQINDFANLTLCYAEPYHRILHTPQEIDLNTNIVYLGGLRQEFQVIRDPEKERQYLRGNVRITKKERE